MEKCAKPEPCLKRPCRCGGHKFVEPEMKVRKCLPDYCNCKPVCECCCCVCEPCCHEREVLCN